MCCCCWEEKPVCCDDGRPGYGFDGAYNQGQGQEFEQNPGDGPNAGYNSFEEYSQNQGYDANEGYEQNEGYNNYNPNMR
jgi:hypothetical protein